MNGIIRIGDKTTGGGVVLAGSAEMIFDNLGAARVGDPVSCSLPGHAPSVIVQGEPAFCDNNVPVAFHGHKCACGCALISSLPTVDAS